MTSAKREFKEARVIGFGTTIFLVVLAGLHRFTNESQVYLPEKFEEQYAASVYQEGIKHAENVTEQAATAVSQSTEETVSPTQEPQVREVQETVKETVAGFTYTPLKPKVKVPIAKVRAVRHPDNNTLHDKTIRWSRSLNRIWLNKHVNETDRPPAQILVTNFGWNHPIPEEGLKHARTTRSTNLIEGVINHPWFHPTAWDDFENSNKTSRIDIDKTIRYYVFLDVETCFETNWPNYASRQTTNSDMRYNRTFQKKALNPCYKGGLGRCRYIQRALKAPIFHTAGVNATLVVYDCAGNGQRDFFRHEKTAGLPVAMVSLSSERHQLRGFDHGQPPPAVKPVVLTALQKQDIEECREESRPFLVVFAGNFRDKTRKALKQLHDEEKGILIFGRKERGKYLNGTTFEDLLAGSKFALSPRGDNLFSYRFTEILSAGAIPIVHSNGWVLPFREELVDWKECALHIPQEDANKTLEIISQIDDKKRCQMRKRCYEIYQKYMRTGVGTITGIVDGLELASAAGVSH
jgi:hypothetical protein